MLPGIGVVVSPDLEDTFREILADEERGQEHQSYVMLLMQMLADGEPLPGLSDAVEETVRDPAWKDGVRCAALDVLVAYEAGGVLETDKLTRMVADIEDDSLDDQQDELLGVLLKALYPRVLSAAEVLRHLREPKLVTTIGEYAGFWSRHVIQESTPDQLGDLLDGIAAGFGDYKTFLTSETGVDTGLKHLPVELLTRVLTETDGSNAGRSIAPDRLHEWLAVVSDPDLGVPEHKKASVKVRLEWDSDALRALIAHGVEACMRRGEECGDFVDRRLFGARPVGYGPWCLKQALGAGEAEAASFYLRELFCCVTDGSRSGGLTVEEARTELAADDVLLSEFDGMVDRWTLGVTQSGGGTVPELSASRESPADTAAQQAWQARIETQAAQLSAGHGRPRLLHEAAEAYLGIRDTSVGKSPRQRLEDLVGSRDDLVDPLLAGLEVTVAREDLPSCEAVVRLFDESWVEWLVLPFAAGLHSLEQSGRLSGRDLNEKQIRLAVTLLYMLPREFLDPDCTGGNGVPRPAWFRDLLRDDPALAADTIRRSAACKLATGVQSAMELRELAEAQDHREVAEMASLSVLESFPSAGTEANLMALCWSLKAALARCEWSSVGRVIDQRVARGDLAVGERGCWLAAGYLVSPERFRDDLLELAHDEDDRKWLAEFVAAGRFPKDLTRRFAAGDVEPLVAVLGATLKIDGLPERAYRAMSQLIAALADDASAAATEALDSLRTMPDAEPWRPEIAEAAERQARKRREREYRHHEISAAVSTLDNGPPANAGDLAALVFEELEDLAFKVRDGNTSPWRQYWNTDRKRPTDPKHGLTSSGSSVSG